MEDTFVLKIQLDDDAMQTTLDVAGALREAADYIAGVGDLPNGRWHLQTGSIRDINGNGVGEWELQ